jgi:hypothetical protein
VVGKDCSTYLTDLYASIQVEYANKNLEIESVRFLRNPINRLATNYYFIKDNKWHAFNCRPDLLDRHTSSEQNALPAHPYQPQFYFAKDFPEFCVEKKKKLTYFLPCNRIRISKWRIKIVNVSLSGWYSPIIEAIDFKIEQPVLREDFSSVSCVVYEE